MRQNCIMWTLLASASTGTAVNAWSNDPLIHGAANSFQTRRSFFSQLPARIAVAGVAVTSASFSTSPQSCAALDMDAFARQQLAQESCDDRVSRKCMPQLSEDEALCRFGQPSPKTGEACLRAGMSTKRPTGVDAFGKIDRGEYVRCKVKYVDDAKTNKLVKTWDCQ
jgi:hypothetical protein